MENVPLHVYTSYLNMKQQYDWAAADGVYTLEVCSSEDGPMYRVIGGVKAGYGVDYFFTTDGNQICHHSWSADPRDNSINDCPTVSNCTLIIGKTF
jgi:hypothetical protein